MVPLHPETLQSIQGTQVLSLIPKRKAPLPPPKTSIPDALIPLLLDKITQLQTGNFTWLVDSIFHELKQYSIKKNAIEAKVREVGEKCLSRKIWVVKPASTVSFVSTVFFNMYISSNWSTSGYLSTGRIIDSCNDTSSHITRGSRQFTLYFCK